MMMIFHMVVKVVLSCQYDGTMMVMMTVCERAECVVASYLCVEMMLCMCLQVSISFMFFFYVYIVLLR